MTNTPQVEEIQASKLVVDPEVQRGVDKPRVDKMAKDFRPDALGVIVVSRREDGTCHVMDGQHRMLAVIAAGFTDMELKCLVYTGLSKAKEAEMFRHLNNARAVLAVDKFRVRVAEGDPVAVVLNNLLNAHGWTVAQSKASGTFAAVGALEGITQGKVNGSGSTIDICNQVIMVITSAWGHNANGVRAEVVAGLGALFLRYNSRVDQAKLVTQLAALEGGPLGLIGRAKGLRDLRGGKLSDATAEILVELVNKQRRTNRLPEWRSVATANA